MLHSMIIYGNFNISINFRPSITFAGSLGSLGSARGRSLKTGRIRRLWRQHVLFLLTQAHAMRLCSVSLKFFNFFLSTTLSTVSTKCLNQFWWNMVTMTNDQARRCPMTSDPAKGHSRSKGSKINIFSKTHQVHQVSWYVHNTHTHDSLQCPLQKLSD